jgi:hypothetical protein
VGTSPGCDIPEEKHTCVAVRTLDLTMKSAEINGPLAQTYTTYNLEKKRDEVITRNKRCYAIKLASI